MLPPVDHPARQALDTAARLLGFTGCRVARAVPTPYGTDLQTWLRDGRHATMAWMERQQEKRLDPALVLPAARSIAILAYPYPPFDSRTAPGRIARYAHGHDYHKLLEHKLADLDETLQCYGGMQKYYTDSGPVNERDYATLSGIGWIGRHRQIIHPKRGSFIFLASILTTLELPADEPFTPRCGSCRRCLDACPGGALDGHSVDARRCISYWTIEHKGSIPEEWRTLIGDRLYGCDACLEACPWNRLAAETHDTRLMLPRSLRTILPRDILSLDDDTFAELFRHSPIRRIKRDGLLRNACCVLGNIGDPDDIPALEQALHDSPLIAEHALWALRRIKEKQTPSFQP